MNLDIVYYVKKKGLTILKMDKLPPKKVDLFIEMCLEKIYRANLAEYSSLKSLLVLDEVHSIVRTIA